MMPEGRSGAPDADRERKCDMTPYIRLSSLAALALAATATAGAFGEAGHRIVGHVAEIHLANTNALKQVRAVLAPGETLADAALWADTIKSATYEDEDTEPFRLEHPAHETYHYTNVAFQAARYDGAAPGAHWTDLVRMTRECIQVLQGESTTFTRRDALRLLAHFLGDIHQPLHVGNAFVSAQPPLGFVVPGSTGGWYSSLGGNALRYGPADAVNLHSYWDTHVVNLETQKEDPRLYAQRLVAGLSPAPDWQNQGDAAGWPEAWATEALAFASDAHKGITVLTSLGADPEGRVAHRWRIQQPAGYDDAAKPRVKVQLAKGGYRLAAVLKAVWP